MVALYALTICTSAALLFLMEPMFARLVLPLLGGAPAVWNTAMVFFQSALLAGYAYAHLLTSRLGTRAQAAGHLLVLLLPLAALPLAIPAGWTPPVAANPAFWLLGLMGVSVGLPFFAVATSSPLLQKWFGTSGGPRAADPYFLYVASNAGSMLALLAYPLWIEPRLTLQQQSRAWMYGYWLLVVLTGICALGLWRSPPPTAAPAPTPLPSSPPPAWRRRLRWLLLAFVPSSLMLSVTAYLSSDVAVVPLLWVVPLAIYLLTFILAFARRQLLPAWPLSRTLPILLVGLVLVFNLQATQPIGALMLLHLLTFFTAAMLCHLRLAADRPSAGHLTGFYLWLAAGGALGGVFNALVAPHLFNSVIEYPLLLLVACVAAMEIPPDADPRARLQDWLWPLALAGITAGSLLAIQALRFKADSLVLGVLFGLPAIICYFFSRRPLRFALGAGALLLAGSLLEREQGRLLYADRSFFGINRVTLDRTGKFHLLVHGVTLHGMQSLDPVRSHEPLTYYTRSGPAGQVLALYGADPRETLGLVGLGTGSLAALSTAGQSWTYYEIDPAVLRIARDEHFFTFLRDAPARVQVTLGDARRSLAAEPDAKFNLLVLDAFSSDAIPVHLVTREALALYLRKLAPGGLLLCHISNLHLDLEPVFANLAKDAHLVCLLRDDTDVSPKEYEAGKSPSVWLVMARSESDATQLAADPRWRPARGNGRQAVWTDDYSSLFSVFRWE
ncbi:MAG TPA: fused MFS/spermidine synthase [Opitutaceae bacterium]|nr:fused MFS/spermidine synthase [Opitutaceae bacterium]